MSSTAHSVPQEPEYAWEIATLYPAQGDWSEDEFFQLTDGNNRRIEFTDGRLEFLPLATEVHEALAQYLFMALCRFVDKNLLGKVYGSGIRLRVRSRKIRLPDVIFLHKDHYHARHNRVWDGADLVAEVVSEVPKDRARDLQDKMTDYAEANIAEYWIIDPERQLVIVHQLQGGQYVVHGEFVPGQQATSALLEGFNVEVTALFDAAKDIPE